MSLRKIKKKKKSLNQSTYMIHQIRKEQFLNARMADVWDFVTSPYNLKKITPEYMNFVIKSKNMTEKINLWVYVIVFCFCF